MNFYATTTLTLTVRGPSETGKSDITRQMLKNAMNMPDLACGRFDFKGTVDVDAELGAFVLTLDVPTPLAGLNLSARFRHVLEALRLRAKPTLLIFDTYENVGQAKDWVEKELLLRLMREPWLRVVIAGQSVPEGAGAVWAEMARAPLKLDPPPPEDWFEFGKPHKPDLTLDFVRRAHEYCQGKSSLLAQILGPVT